MKNFKNKLSVKGSRSLLKAFAEELDKLGYKKDKMSGDINWLLTPTAIICNYDKARYGFHNHDGISEQRIYVNLPQDWNKGLELAAEIEEEIPEYVECIKKINMFGKLNTIYKVIKWHYSYSDCKLEGSDSGSVDRKRFKPSTKEAYEAQELAKPQIGKWYISKQQNGILACCTSLDKDGSVIGYGINNIGHWDNDGTKWFGSDFSKSAVLASDEEVEFRLLEYAKKHYFNGVLIKGLSEEIVIGNMNCGKEIRITDEHHHRTQDLLNQTVIYTSPNVYLYATGKWAEILPNEVKVNGYVVTKLNDTTVKVGCKQFQIFTLNDICNFIAMYGGTYNIDNVNWTAIDISKVISEFNKM